MEALVVSRAYTNASWFTKMRRAATPTRPASRRATPNVRSATTTIPMKITAASP